MLPLFLGVFALQAAEIAAGGLPASSNVRGAEYPKILPDPRVTFVGKAPGAQTLQVMPGWQVWRKDLHDFAPRLFQE